MIAQKIANFFSRILEKSWGAYALIAVIIFAVYSQTLFHNIVYLDDNTFVTEQHNYNQNLSNLPMVFEEDVFHKSTREIYYRPILRVSFMFDAQFGGETTNIFMSHLSNIIIHIFAISLLFRLLIKLSIKKETALSFALIFGVHPLTTHVVSWIPGRNDSLLAIFTFASFIFFLNYLEQRKWRHYLWHLIFFAAALWTKETAMVIPIILMLYVLIRKDLGELKKNYRQYLWQTPGWVLLLVFYFASRYSVFSTLSVNGKLNIFSSIYENLPSLIPTIGKIFLPFNLSVVPILEDMSITYGSITLIFFITYFILSKDKDYRMIIFGTGWFLIFIVLTLANTTGFVPNFFENRIYLPMFGFIFILLGMGKIKFFENLLYKKHITILTIVVILGLATITIHRNQYYKNEISFWQNAVETSPNYAFNHNGLAIAHYRNDDLDKAEVEFKNALELKNGEELTTHYVYGVLLVKQNRFAEAEKEFKKELAIDPYYYNAHFGLGTIYYNLGLLKEAKKEMENALNINPSLIEAKHNLDVINNKLNNLK